MGFWVAILVSSQDLSLEGLKNREKKCDNFDLSKTPIVLYFVVVIHQSLLSEPHRKHILL